MIKYKLTTQDLKTHNGFQWEVGKEVVTNGENDLCSEGWLHYYHHYLLAVLLSPIHFDISNPLLWEVNADGDHKDDKGLKGGCTRMSLIKQIPLPKVSPTQKTAFAILCAKQVYNDIEWNKWAGNWLNKHDRSESAAESAAWSAVSAARSAAWSAAASAAWSAAWSAARSAAWNAAYSARDAVRSADVINLIEIAEQAMQY